MRSFCLYAVTPLISFIGGLLSYIMILKFGWGESLGGDLKAVLFWGCAAYCIIVPFYFGVIYLIDRRFMKHKGFLYPTACMLIFIIPTLPLLALFGIENVFSPEVILFNSFFVSSGLIFGFCTWIFKK